MTNLKSIILFGSALLLLTSCATSYKQIKPYKLNYSGNSGTNEVEFSYQTNVLTTSGNKKYANKENKNDISIVAVRIINNSSEEITLGKNASIQSNYAPVRLLSPTQITSKIKQNAGAYLLYLLLTPMELQVQVNDKIDTYNIGYVIGPAISLLNIANASGANSAFGKELSEFSLLDKTIQPGETVYGLVGISNYSYSQLTLSTSY